MELTCAPLDRLPECPEEETPEPALYGTIQLMHHAFGDVKKKWDRNNPEEVADAKRSFEELTGRGFAAFQSDPKTGEKAGPMRVFDPTAEGLIMVPPLVAG